MRDNSIYNLGKPMDIPETEPNELNADKTKILENSAVSAAEKSYAVPVTETDDTEKSYAAPVTETDDAETPFAAPETELDSSSENINNNIFGYSPFDMKNTVIRGEKGFNYRIRSDIAKSGESDLYLCENDKKEEFILKLFRGKNIDMNKRSMLVDFLNNTDCPYIIRLVDYGMLEGNCFDVYPYYKDGDLSRNYLSDEDFLINIVIPQMNTALHELHTHNIIHRDIKPSNIYYDKQKNHIVIGDFGIVSITDNSVGEAVTQSDNKTIGFAAPELFSDRSRGGEHKIVVDSLSDYYAMGITLLCLLMGKNIYAGYSDTQIYTSTIRGKIPYLDKKKFKNKKFDANSKRDRIEGLICGLLINDLNERWGYDDVRLWLDGKKVAPSVGFDAANSFIKEYTINGIQCRNYKELAAAMITNWDESKKSLYRGYIGAFVGGNEIERGENISLIIEDEKFSTIQSRSAGLFRCLYIIDDGLNEFAWKGKLYKSLFELVKSLPQDKPDTDFVYMLKTNTVSWFMENKISGVSSDLINAIKEIENRSETNEEEAYYRFLFRFREKQKEIAYTLGDMTAYNIDDIINYMSKNPDKVKFVCDSLVSDIKFKAWLIHLGYIYQAKTYFETDIKDMNIRKTLELLDVCGTNKQDVRKLALYHSEYAPIYWLVRNTENYIYNGVRAFEIKSYLDAVKINDNTDVHTIYSQLGALNEHFSAFALLTINAPITSIAGVLKASGDNIIPKNMSGQFLGEYNGVKVPLGFLSEAGLPIYDVSVDKALSADMQAASHVLVNIKAEQFQNALSMSENANVSEITGAKLWVGFVVKAAVFLASLVAALVVRTPELLGIALVIGDVYIAWELIRTLIGVNKNAPLLAALDEYGALSNEISGRLNSLGELKKKTVENLCNGKVEYPIPPMNDLFKLMESKEQHILSEIRNTNDVGILEKVMFFVGELGFGGAVASIVGTIIAEEFYDTDPNITALLLCAAAFAGAIIFRIKVPKTRKYDIKEFLICFVGALIGIIVGALIPVAIVAVIAIVVIGIVIFIISAILGG